MIKKGLYAYEQEYKKLGISSIEPIDIRDRTLDNLIEAKVQKTVVDYYGDPRVQLEKLPIGEKILDIEQAYNIVKKRGCNVSNQEALSRRFSKTPGITIYGIRRIIIGDQIRYLDFGWEETK